MAANIAAAVAGLGAAAETIQQEGWRLGDELPVSCSSFPACLPTLS